MAGGCVVIAAGAVTYAERFGGSLGSMLAMARCRTPRVAAAAVADLSDENRQSTQAACSVVQRGSCAL